MGGENINGSWPSILVEFSWHAEAVHQRAELLGLALGAADPAGGGGGGSPAGVVDHRAAAGPIACISHHMTVGAHDKKGSG